MEMEEDNNCTPEEITSVAQEVTKNLLPEKSKDAYNKSYNKFIAWKLENNIRSFSENVFLAYFQNLRDKFKPSSLWVEYSKLKSTIILYHQTDISTYSKLLAFLKRKSEGFKAKKARTFSPDNIKVFINEAPDENYLLIKVAVIFGIMGACRRQELHNIKINNIIDSHETLVVNIVNTKNRIDRTFTVTGKYYQVCKKYFNLRPNPCNNPNLFLRYFGGKCTSQNIGINTFGQMGKAVANFLKLPNPELYTGHCFRRTSATLLVDAGGDITSLKWHGGWKSTTVAEGYIDNSIQSRVNVSKLLMSTIDEDEAAQKSNIPSTSTVFEYEPTETKPPTPTPDRSVQDTNTPISTSSTSVQETTNGHEVTLSQIIKQNADVNINTKTSSIAPTVNISNNTIQNLHLHFHK